MFLFALMMMGASANATPSTGGGMQLRMPPPPSPAYRPTLSGTSLEDTGNVLPNDTSWLESTEFVDQDIRDVLRAIARAHSLNIFPAPEVHGKVTLSLHRMPVIQALRNITNLLGYELAWENQAYVVRLPQARVSTTISMGIQNITLSVQSQDLRKFADDFASRTGLNILVDKNAKGTITGKLHNVEPVEGLRALLISNGFALKSQGETWIVMSDDTRSGSGSSSTSIGYSSGSSRGGSRIDMQVRKGLVTAQLRQAAIGDVLQQLIDGSGYSMVCYGQLSGTVDATFRSVPVLKAMELILQGTSYTFALRDSTLLVGDRNPGGPSGQVLSTTEMIYLRHMRVDKVVPLVPRTLSSVALQAVSELNALLVSGTVEQIEKVRDFLTTVDQQVPQVVMEAIIVEFSKGNTSELGIKSGARSDSALGGPVAAMNFALAGSNTKALDLNGFKLGTMGVLPQSFMLQLNALEGSNKARVLARPRITTLNGQMASINVGTTDYFQVTTTNTNGVVTSDYRTFNSGITLSITPFVTRSGQITAEIKPEVRTPTSAVTSDAARPPSTSTRSISANVRLKNGETLVLGGLIQSLDLTTNTGVPLLSAIPFIGRLFSYKNTQKTTTELAVFITPHVIDSLPELDLDKEIDTMDQRVNGTGLDRLFRSHAPSISTATGVPRTPAPSNVPAAIKPDTATKPSATVHTSTKPTAVIAMPTTVPAPAATTEAVQIQRLPVPDSAPAVQPSIPGATITSGPPLESSVPASVPEVVLTPVPLPPPPSAIQHTRPAYLIPGEQSPEP
jgi:type IV pilus assembly protein PilQ